MAVKKKVVDIETGQAEKSVKSLRNQLKDLKDQLVNLEQGTQEYNEVLQQAANIQHDLTEMNQELAASAMDFGEILGNATKTINGAVSGFQALTASMSLLGIENEDTLETIKKLQSLMALTQGIAGVENGIKAFKRLILAITNSTAVAKLFNKTQQTTAVTENVTATATKGLQGAMVGEAAATGTATVATKAFKKALISTGIGAIVVAIGTLIAHLEDLAKWFGIGNNSAEEHKKKMAQLEAQYSDFNSTIQQYEYYMDAREREHKTELKLMDEKIAKMKAEGASEAELLAQQEKDLERRKDIANEELRLVQDQRNEIRESYAEITKSVNGFAETVTNQNVYTQLAAYSKILENEKTYLQSLKDSDASDNLINKSEERITQYNQILKILKDYIGTMDKAENVRNDVLDREKNIQNERIANLRKYKEEYAKFNQSLELDGLKNKEKELKQTENAEKERLKTLKKYRQEGAITTAEYEKKVTEITELYSQQRLEIEYKYAEQAFKKREDVLKQQFNLEKAEAERREMNQQAMLEKERQNNLDVLNRREISIVDYYKREKELIQRNYEEQRALLVEDFKRQSDLISEQINERYELMAQNGISDEQKAKLTQEIATMSDQLLTLQVQHNTALQDLAIETNNAIAETTRDIVDVEIENLHSMVDNVVGSMDAIAACGDGISTAWAGAFETLSNGLINLTEKIKTGGAQWQDYGQLAVAGLQAASQVMNGLASQQDAQTKEGFEKQKKYQIAAATMSMLAGVTAALSGLFTTKSGPWDIALAAIQAGIITATGIAQIVKIKQQKFDGGGSSSSASPSTSAMGSVVAPVQYTQDIQGASIEGAIKDTKVYVTETDITNTQNKVDVAESEARY